MRVLVSVANAADALVALAAGADVIDAKNPTAGALGAVALEELRAIVDAIRDERPVTAALGDGSDGDPESAAYAFGAAGAALVKIGFAGMADRAEVESVLRAAIRGAKAGSARTGVVAVAYADADRAASIAPAVLIDVAARAGAEGVLIDTADKSGPGLHGLMSLRSLGQWVTRARGAGLLVAVAGKLTADDLWFARQAGADIAGVRGAACDGGRGGRISADKVRRLVSMCDGSDEVVRPAVHSARNAAPPLHRPERSPV